jgi:hypothetical protein
MSALLEVNSIFTKQYLLAGFPAGSLDLKFIKQ